MIGGGSSPPPAPPPVDPMAEAQAQMAIDRQLAEMRRADEAAAAERQAAADAADQARFDTELAGARGAAGNRIRGRFESEFGLDPNQYGSAIEAELDRIAGGINNRAQNVGSYFAGDLTNPLVNRLTETQNRGLGRQLDQFGGAGFASNLYTGTEDDAIIDAIIGERFTDAGDVIDRAYARGTLSDQGLERARNELGSARTAATSRLQDIGGGLLEGFREQARNRVGTARQQIGNLGLGQQFDVGGVQSGLNTQRAENLAGLEGGIRRGIGSDPLFNTSDIIQRGAIAQGLINPARATGGGVDLRAALTRRRQDEDRQRGLGTQGVI